MLRIAAFSYTGIITLKLLERWLRAPPTPALLAASRVS